MSTPAEDFNPLIFEKKLTQLKDTQECIQTLSSWCLQKRQHHKKIVASWLNVLKRAKVDHRLTLFYLANDVIQYSKRKNYEFVESWGTTLQKATPLVRDDKVKHRILRIFRIWEERGVYDEEFLTDLTGLLSAAAGKQTPDIDPNDFHAIQLVNKIRQCSVLEGETDCQMKLIHENPLALKDADALCSSLKERRDVDEARHELEDGVSCLEGYVRALQKELVARAALCRLLQRAHQHYTTQRGEVKVVANAYKNFGARVRGLKRKLDELCTTLPSSQLPPAAAVPSPLPSPPSPGEAVPSPGPDEDIDLPGQNSENYNLDKTFSTSILGDDMVNKGFTSFMGQGDFPFFGNDEPTDDRGGNKIEVISSRPATTPREDFNINEFLKSLIPSKTAAPKNVPEAPPSAPFLPGLDLLAPPPPPPNFYGTANIPDTPEPVPVPAPEPYISDHGSQWNNSWENLQVPVDTPESPPPVTSPPPPPRFTEGPPPPRPDVDHRTLMAPPPPPRLPPLLLEGDDVDHRLLPPLPAVSSPVPSNERNHTSAHKVDVDHRNLISLTGVLLPPPAPPISPWTPLSQQVDQDYRSMGAETPTPPQQRLPKVPQHPPKNVPSHSSANAPPHSPNHRMTHTPSTTPPAKTINHHPPANVTHLPPNMMHHPPNNLPNMPLLLSNMTQHPPNMSQPAPNMSQQTPPQHHTPNMLQYSANMPNLMSSMPPSLPNMPHQPQNMPHQPQNMPHQLQNMPHQPQNMPHQPQNMPHQLQNMALQPQNMPPPNILQHPPNPPNMQNLQNVMGVSHLPPNMPHHPPSVPHHQSNLMMIPPPSIPDNIESIDMEMSDEEIMYDQDDDYGRRHSRVEMKLARLHGNIMPRHNQPPPQQFNRKMDHQREMSFNNKVLVGGNTPAINLLPQKTDPTITDNSARSNLVRINNVTKEEKNNLEARNESISIDLVSDEEYYSQESTDAKKAEDVPSVDVFSDKNVSMNPMNPNLEEFHEKTAPPYIRGLSQSSNASHDSSASQGSNASQNFTEDAVDVQVELVHWGPPRGGMNPPRPGMGPRMRFPVRGPPRPNFMFHRPERFFPPERGRRPWGRPPRHFW